MKMKRTELSIGLACLLAAFLFLNMAFPKAGTKIGNFPIYLSVIVSYLAVLPVLLARTTRKWNEKTEISIYLYLLAVVLTLAADLLFFLITGNLAKPGTDFLLAYYLSLGSILFVLVFSYYTPEQARLKEAVILSFAIITLYGFIQKLFGDVRVIVPGLTMNYSDFVHLPNWWDKSNYVVALHYIKLSSTYQNGNLFGVNYILISWFALYFLDRAKTPLRRAAFYLSLAAYSVICLLTFSGTVFIGLFMTLLLYYVYRLAQTWRGQEKNRLPKLMAAIVVPVLVLAAAVLALNLVPQLSYIKDALFNRLLNRDFIGNERIKYFLPYLQYLWDNKLVFQFLFGSILDAKRLGGSYEITLAAVFFNSGILFAGIFAYAVYRIARKWKFEIFSIGLFTYLLLSFIDGAFWLPPTPVVFFTLAGAGIYLSKKQERTF
jgi:hypothetical protein